MSHFYKMTGSGNDFIVLDASLEPVEAWPVERIQAVCNRRFGVGADGVLLLNWARRGQVSMKYFNSDGSPAPVCGNALLCTARLTALLRQDQFGLVDITTEIGTFRAEATRTEDWVRLTWPTPVTVQEIQLIEKERGERQMFLGNVGVPHLCVIVGDVNALNVGNRGRDLRSHPTMGTSGANINFVTDHGPLYEVRTYERGIEAETYACITGALACAVALVQAGLGELPRMLCVHSGREVRIEGKIAEDGLKEATVTSQASLIFTGSFGLDIGRGASLSEREMLPT
jgi:diaminopimelate epimerase